MGLAEKINKDMIAAMKSGDNVCRDVLRMLKSELKYKRIELNDNLTDDELSDEDCLTVIASAAKKRRDAIIGFEKGGRDDLVAKEEKDEKIWELLNEVFEKLNDCKLKAENCKLIYYYFFWNLVSFLGYQPELRDGAICGKKINVDIFKILRIIL